MEGELGGGAMEEEIGWRDGVTLRNGSRVRENERETSLGKPRQEETQIGIKVSRGWGRERRVNKESTLHQLPRQSQT